MEYISAPWKAYVDVRLMREVAEWPQRRRDRMTAIRETLSEFGPEQFGCSTRIGKGRLATARFREGFVLLRLEIVSEDTLIIRSASYSEFYNPDLN